MTEDLRHWYRQSLSKHIAGLKASIESLDEGALRRRAHQLRGSAGSYGLPELGECAGRLEDAHAASLIERAHELLSALRESQTPLESTRHKVLLVEDDPDIHTLIACALPAPTWELTIARTLSEGRRLLADHDLVILDLVLDEGDGRDLLREARSKPVHSSLPIVILSAHNSPANQAECFALGADAWFQKPIPATELALALSSLVERRQQAREAQMRDPLTGLANRALLDESFQRLSALSQRRSRPVSLAILDIDHFKTVNDWHGHAAGDEVLVVLAGILNERLRGSDRAARWGGEEFVIVLPDTDEPAAVAVLDELRRVVATQTFSSAKGTFSVSFSAGVTAVQPEEGLDTAVARADARLYAAKLSGRNQIKGSGPTEDTPAAVLLVEDDPDMARLVSGLLEREGWKVDCCALAGDAIRALATGAYRLAVVDLDLPDMSGRAVLAASRGCPVLILTAAQGAVPLASAFAAGAADYVSKPFSPLELQARVRRLIRL